MHALTKMLQNAMLVARKASCHVVNAFFDSIEANLANIQPENLQNVKKCVFGKKHQVLVTQFSKRLVPL